MQNIWTIAKREYKLYFAGPVAYVVAFLFLGLVGYFFYRNLASAIEASLFQPYTPSVQMVIAPMVTLVLFTMPALTMRLFAEEQRTGTIELLLTAPVRDGELVIGKWLGGLFYVLTLLAITLVFPFALHRMTNPGIDQGPLVTGYLGLLLMMGSLVAVGTAVSTLFSNQIAAFFTSLGLTLVVWLIGSSSSTSSGIWQELLNNLNFIDHFMSFYRGIIDLKDVVYFLSITVLALFLGTISLEIRRWR